MDAPTDLTEVYGAIFTLYDESVNPNENSAEKNERKLKASKWLQELQKSIHSWRIADQLLHDKKDLKSCFFAAQTLRTKVAYFFGELPESSHASLRDSMMDHLSHITDDTYNGIVTQLCVAVADLALLCPSWRDPFSDLVSQFGINGTRCNLVPLLEVLIAIPEEMNSRQLKLGQTRREAMVLYCKTKVSPLISMLNIIICDANLRKLHEVKVLRCLSSWFNLQTKDWAELAQTNLMTYMLSVVKNPTSSPGTHEIATDCICSAMIMLGEMHVPKLSDVLISSVLMLEEPFHMAVAMEDLGAVTNYARMFAELGECLVEVMVNTQPPPNPATDQVLNLLLICVGHHEWEVAEITFNYWYKLSEFLYRKDSEELNLAFAPHIVRLFEALYRHCQIDVDHEGVLIETDDFFEFRERVQELIKDVVFICQSKNCFAKMASLLEQPESQKSWPTLESALFIMQSVAKNLMPNEQNPTVVRVVECILTQPVPPLPNSNGTFEANSHPLVHMQVAVTSLQLLAELNEWLVEYPHFLPPILNFCTVRLQCPLLATYAAKTLDSVCSSCYKHVEPYFDGLMQIVTSLDSFVISNWAVVGFLKAVANILNRFSNDKIKSNMEILCGLQINKLNALLEDKTPNGTSIERGSKKDPIVWLDRLSAIFRHVSPRVEPNGEHPCQAIVMSMWPTIKSTMDKYFHDIRVTEHCCRYLRFAVRCVKKHSAPLLPHLVETIVKMYSGSGHSCFVYLGSILTDEYGTEPSCVGGLISMLEAFTPKTFEMLSQPGGFKNCPDTVDDWFRLCTRFLQRCPIPFLQCPVRDTIVQCGLQAVLLDHKDANAAVLKFFQDLCLVGTKRDTEPDYPTRRHLVEEVMNNHITTLVDNLITAVVFILPPYMHHEVAETLYQCMSFDRAKLVVVLDKKLKNLSRTNSTGSIAVTEEQVSQLKHTITGAQRSKDITRSLIEFSKFYT